MKDLYFKCQLKTELLGFHMVNRCKYHAFKMVLDKSWSKKEDIKVLYRIILCIEQKQ